jgi:hypothetical protein
VSPQMTVLLLSFLITATWLSVRSWMRSLQSLISAQSLLREAQIQGLEDRLEVQHRQQEVKQREREERLLELAELSQRRLLMEAFRPLAEALQRQDSSQLQQNLELKELLLEVLSSLQPSAQEQISQRIGQPPQKSSFPSLVS